MKVRRIRLQRFRGFQDATFTLPGSAVLAGEPQAGRTDLIEALRRVLDPRSTRSRINPLDVHRPVDRPDVLTEVEVTILDLGPELEALFDDNLEAFDSATGDLATQDNAKDAVLGLRLCYRASYDIDSDTGEHWVDYPSASTPAANIFKRVGRIEREALPVGFIDSAPALQLGAEGALRALLREVDAPGLEDALTHLDEKVHSAMRSFTHSDVVEQVLRKVMDAGPRDLFGIEEPAAFGFAPGDGSLAGLLRGLQPTISMTSAGPLPVRSHGSTLQSVLSVAEAVAAAQQTQTGAVIIGDDFGDGLDTSSSEYMARLLLRTAGQVILTTRRPEVVRAFNPEELIRLTVSHGVRRQHRLPATTDKTARTTRRLILEQLITALSSRSVVLVEGPLDVEGYDAFAAELFRKTSKRSHSLAANGIRLVAPPGTDGGITRLPAIAEMALQLGFHVRAIVDNDRPGQEDPAVTTLAQTLEQLIVLPPRTAVEAALVRGVPGPELRRTVALLRTLGMPELPDGIGDDEIADHLIHGKILKKQGLLAAWAHALVADPPIARSIVEAACGGSLGRVDIPNAVL